MLPHEIYLDRQLKELEELPIVEKIDGIKINCPSNQESLKRLETLVLKSHQRKVIEDKLEYLDYLGEDWAQQY